MSHHCSFYLRKLINIFLPGRNVRGEMSQTPKDNQNDQKLSKIAIVHVRLELTLRMTENNEAHSPVPIATARGLFVVGDDVDDRVLRMRVPLSIRAILSSCADLHQATIFPQTYLNHR